MEIIIDSLNKKIEYSAFSHVDEIDLSATKKITQLIILDNNAIKNRKISDDELKALFETRHFIKTKKIFIHGRNASIDKKLLEGLGFNHFLTKPFLPEEFIELINANLGGRS